MSASDHKNASLGTTDYHGRSAAGRLSVLGNGKQSAAGQTPVGQALVGVLLLLGVFAMVAAVALACEGVGGPPSSPTAAEQYGLGPNPGAPKVARSVCGLSVDCATGNEAEQETDLGIGGRGPGLRMVRSYNGLSAAEASEAGPWGFGWTGSYDASLVVSGETATVHQDNGSVLVFYKSGTEYTQGGWEEGRLVKEGSNYIYTLPDQTKLEFNSEGKLTKETERRGSSNTLTYKEGKLEKVTDGASRTLTFKYNGEGLVESVTDPMKHVVSYTYSSKNLASVTIEGKARWKFEYEAPHLLKKITDGRESPITIEYDSSHRIKSQTLAKHERKWKYGSTPGTETTLTEPNASETFEKFNTAGEPTKETLAKGTGVETTTEDEYNATTYNVTKLTDPNKHETKYGYDSEGNLTSEVDPNKDETTWEYDKKHNVIKETTPEGEATTIKRNATSGEPEVVERPVGAETQKTEFKYNVTGDLSEVIDTLKHATTFTYDTYGDPATETDPEKNVRKWKDNEDSQVTEETSPRGFATTIERDEQGRPKKITDPLKHLVEYNYNGDGEVESVTDGNKNTTKDEYNEEDLPTKVEEPSSTVEMGYDSEGQMTSRTDGNKHVWEYKRNELEQVTEEKNPLGKITKKKYYKTGNVESIEDPEKHTTEYTYDESNRPKAIKYSTGKPSEVSYEYNKDSLVKKMTDGSGTTENTWDKLDRLEKYKSGAGKTIEYKYNLANEPTKITYPNGKSITRSYDNDGRLESMTDWKSNVTSFKYNADSQPSATAFPVSTEEEDTYSYNEADQMTEVTMKGPLGATLGKLVYERDGDGQLKKTTTTTLPGPATVEDKYDGDSRLAEDNKLVYEYDKANNPTKLEGTGTYSYNEADQLKEGPEAKYVFNEDGQRAKTEPKSGEPATTYGYDQASNLTSVERLKGTKEPEINDSFTYDGNRLRQTQTISGTKTNLTWDTAEELPLALNDETNNYIYGPENVPIEQISTNAEETVLYLHHDQQGSTRLLTSSKGKSEAEYTYNPYGTLNAKAGAASTPLRYDGQYTSTDPSGLIYLQARTYEPKTAQFLSVDPALETTGEPYSYAADNSLNAADPTGEQIVVRYQDVPPYSGPGTPAAPPVVTANPGTPQQPSGWTPAPGAQRSPGWQPGDIPSTPPIHIPAPQQDTPWIRNPGGSPSWQCNYAGYQWFTDGINLWRRPSSASNWEYGGQFSQPRGTWARAQGYIPTLGRYDVNVFIPHGEDGVWVSFEGMGNHGGFVRVQVWVPRRRQ